MNIPMYVIYSPTMERFMCMGDAGVTEMFQLSWEPMEKADRMGESDVDKLLRIYDFVLSGGMMVRSGNNWYHSVCNQLIDMPMDVSELVLLPITVHQEVRSSLTLGVETFSSVEGDFTLSEMLFVGSLL
jgi:hypothetical protein